MSNPFEDDNPFGLQVPQTQQQPQSNGGDSRRASLNAGGGAGSLKAQQMFAASQAAAAAAAAAEANAPARREGASASAFDSRERNARMSMLQSNQGKAGQGGVAFPMTDLVDAQNDKTIGLSFASLAVREHHGHEIHSEEGQAQQPMQAQIRQQPQAAPAAKASRPQPAAAAIDPWSQSAFGGGGAVQNNDPFGLNKQQPAAQPAVFRNPPQQQRAPQPVQQQARAPAAANLMDFDPLSFGDAPKPAAAAADPWAHLEQSRAPAAAAAAPKPKTKAKAPVVESSSSEEDSSSEEEEDDAAAAAAAAAEAKRLRKQEAAAKKAREEQLAERERLRAEAVAYDTKRKADLAAARRNSGSGAASSSASSAAPRGGGMQSRALDATDEAQAAEIVRNETNADKLKRSGSKVSYPKAVVEKWGSNPAEHWAYSKSKTRTALMMPKVCVYWRFIWAGVRHEVELFHSTVSGKRTVKCDGALVAQEKLFIDTGSRHDFTVGTGTHPCNVTVLIVSSGSEYAYELFIERVRFYQALQGWLIELQKDPGAASKLEPLSPTAINTVTDGRNHQQRRMH